MIEEYHFGSIIIDGKVYDHDVQIFSSGQSPLDSKHPTGQVKSWWRKTSHEVILDDICEVLEQKPEIIVFGTGSPGMMEVFDRTQEKIKSLGIELIIEPTKEAIKKFNELKTKNENVVGLFHLTC